MSWGAIAAISVANSPPHPRIAFCFFFPKVVNAKDTALRAAAAEHARERRAAGARAAQLTEARFSTTTKNNPSTPNITE